MNDSVQATYDDLIVRLSAPKLPRDDRPMPDPIEDSARSELYGRAAALADVLGRDIRADVRNARWPSHKGETEAR
jgi:hypothetical protein